MNGWLANGVAILSNGIPMINEGGRKYPAW